ncbi:HTH-type transcriptional regulator ImmR [Pelotomaculum schinkii]|uniref:HTH-type transcriptional regulator ImmR n=1 Tax=Pelotomaculum schinkii TaxID=78350 RepID=A0A4Y7R7F8_9FIRM|nr:helix-turn-helix transcriptional regulator [Pelotomaculum schinkii]TEB04777.1 HTH-type transcriptional regulator ImmR [Pelotomaculum schinkii]
MSIGKRLKEARTYLKLTQEKFAQPLAITRGYIASMENDLQEPSDTLLKLISIEHGISIAWLKTGEGEMLTSPEEALKNLMARFGEQTIIAAFAGLLKEHNLIMPNGGLGSRHAATGDPALNRMVGTLCDLWAAGDDKIRNWAEVQFDLAIPHNVIEELQKKQKDSGESQVS